MRQTKTVRKIDELGRIVLPADLRKQLELEPRDAVEIFSEDDRIIIRKFAPTCVFCGSAENNITFGERKICPECLKKLAELN